MENTIDFVTLDDEHQNGPQKADQKSTQSQKITSPSNDKGPLDDDKEEPSVDETMPSAEGDSAGSENTIDFVTLDDEDQNGPQKADEKSTQSPKIASPSNDKGPLDDDKEEPSGDEIMPSAEGDSAGSENAIDFVTLDDEDQNGPQKADEKSTQSPKIASPSNDKGPLEDDKEEPSGDEIMPSADGDSAGSDQKADNEEEPSGDKIAPSAGKVAEEDNAGGDQSPTRKRVREDGDEKSGENQSGLEGDGDDVVVQGPVRMFPCPWKDCGEVFAAKKARFEHITKHTQRPGEDASPPSQVSREEGMDEAEEEAEGMEVSVLLSPEAPKEDEAAATAGGAIEAPEVARRDIDLNVVPFLLPDLNLSPPEYCG